MAVLKLLPEPASALSLGLAGHSRAGDRLLLIDGGDRGCGELLLLVLRQVRNEPAGSIIGILTSDPAAVIDIPAWCHLTGHRYHGRASPQPDAPFVVEIDHCPTPVDPDRPWHPLPRMENT
jgi:tRNA 2-thiouridine synthesizing protein A